MNRLRAKDQNNELEKERQTKEGVLRASKGKTCPADFVDMKVSLTKPSKTFRHVLTDLEISGE